MTERKPNPIIRREKFKVLVTEVNQYGDLIVTSENGTAYKIGKKRDHLFDVFQIGVEVVVGYANYMDKDYIAEATLATQLVSADTPIEGEKPRLPKDLSGGQAPTKKAIPQETPAKQISDPEIGMWYKEIGEGLRSGFIDRNSLVGKALELAYSLRMQEALGIKIEEAPKPVEVIPEEVKKATKEQIEDLNEYKKKGIDLKAMTVKMGWKVTTLGALTYEQAEMLLNICSGKEVI